MKLKQRKKVGFIVALVIPLLILGSLTIKPLMTMTSGEDISLLTVPVDPRDLFYGDYVTLAYEIEEVNETNLSPSLLKRLNERSSYGKTPVYGKLIQENDVFVLEELTDKKPKSGIYLTGKVYPHSYTNSKNETIYNVDFGLERFFVPENTGMELEKLSQQGQLVAHIKVRNGHALLQSIEKAETN